jgi:hypothetical protein
MNDQPTEPMTVTFTSEELDAITAASRAFAEHWERVPQLRGDLHSTRTAKLFRSVEAKARTYKREEVNNMTMIKQEDANVEATLAAAELSRAHARLMNAQAAALEVKTEKNK